MRWRLAFAVLGVAGCASRPLPELEELPELRKLAEVADALPGETGRVAGADIEGGPVELAYRETWSAETEWLVVLVHGVLSDARTWRFVAGDLGLDHDLLLLDLPGCGGSDKPAPAAVGEGGYSPTALARHVLCAVRARLAGRDRPARVALVGHSLGSMVILRMTGDPALRAEFADVLGRVERVVLLSPVDFAVERKHPVFDQIVNLSGVEVTVADLTRILDSRATRSVRQGAVDPTDVPQCEADRLVEVLSDPPRRRAAQAMIREAVPFTANEQPDWPRIRRLVADYANVRPPCLILHGACDETFSCAMGYKLRDQLPNAWLHVLEAKHALPSEAPRRCAEEIRGFLARAGEGRPRLVDETFVPADAAATLAP
jgi:pimeloyl-ACP methyl ester carboxylesterase